MLKTPGLSRVFHRNLDPSKYRVEIDGLRFFAIMNVMIGHLMERVQRFWLAPNPHLDNPTINGVISFLASPSEGVLLFFAISGFIIAQQMQDVGRGKFDARFVGRYYVRRITRIFPPYYLLLIATFIAVFFFQITPPSSERFSGSDAPLPASFMASLLYAHGAIFNSLPRLFGLGWSLEVEVQFYLIAPLMFLMLAGPDAARPFRYLLMLGVCLLLAALSRAWVLPLNGPTVVGYGIYFAAGITMARYEHRLQSAFAWMGSRASALVGCACVLILFWLPTTQIPVLKHPVTFLMINLAVIVTMFGMAFQPTTLFGRFCRQPYVIYIGMACYSLYLVHMHVMHLGALAIAQLVPVTYASIAIASGALLAAGLAAGAIFFILVEKPFANYRPTLFARTRSSDTGGEPAPAPETRTSSPP